MSKSATRLQWCIARLGEDLNWWVDEISDEIHWDLDGLSIVDPKQVSHIMDLLEALRDYDVRMELFDDAFFKFKIEKKLDENRLRLVRSSESLIESDQMLFALPNTIDEDKSAYADFLDHVTRMRVRMLNDLIDFERKFTIEELEEEIREEQNNQFIEGRAIHSFKEITDIIEYVPTGFELDEEESSSKDENDAIEDDFPDIDEEPEEKIDEDDTMSWEEEAETETDGFHEVKDEENDIDMSIDDDEEEEDYVEEEEEKPKKTARKRRK